MPRASGSRDTARVGEQSAAWHAGPFLPDVNVLVALIDPMHNQHATAHDWFQRHAGSGWATCPLTENGVLRIVGHARYRNPVGSPAACAMSLSSLCDYPGHRFWPDDISLLRSERVDLGKLGASAQVTDTYLLALAMHHGGRLASFDRRLVTSAVHDGGAALHLIT